VSFPAGDAGLEVSAFGSLDEQVVALNLDLNRIADDKIARLVAPPPISLTTDKVSHVVQLNSQAKRALGKQVLHAPDLGLTMVDLDDGSFSKTKIFRVSGLPEEDRDHGNRHGDTKKPIGTFYVQFNGNLAAYDLPGGAITMVFTGQNVQEVPDGQGGSYIIGTFELDIPEATGVRVLCRWSQHHGRYTASLS
jgi:hypothetical protein